MKTQVLQKKSTIVHAVTFEGGLTNGMEICKWIGGGSAYIPPTKEDPQDYVQVTSIFGPRDVPVGDYIVKIGENSYVPYKNATLYEEYKPVLELEDHMLVKHARYELSLFDEDLELVESIINAIKGFAAYPGHSGGSAAVTIDMITKLISGENLLPLTNDPDEWVLHEGKNYGLDYDMWQSLRNSKAISEDGGKSYFLIDEAKVGGEKVIHFTQDKDFVPEIQPEDLLSEGENLGDPGPDGVEVERAVGEPGDPGQDGDKGSDA